MSIKCKLRSKTHGEVGQKAYKLITDLQESLNKAEAERDKAWNKAIEEAANVCENTDQEYEPYVGTPKMLNYTCADAVRKLMK